MERPETRPTASPERERLLVAALEAGDAAALNEVGIAAGAADDREQAARAFRTAAALGETSAWSNLGLTLEQLDRPEAAAAAYQSAIAGGQSEDRVALAQLLLYALDDAPRGVALLEAAADDREPDASHRLGLQRTREGRDDEALTALARAIEEEPSGIVLHSMADALRYAGRPAESLPFYDRAADDGYRDALLDRAFALEDLDQQEEAEQAFRAAVEQDVDDAVVSYASWLGRRGRADEELAVLRRAAAGGDASVLVDLGNRLTDDDVGSREEGLLAYRRAILGGSRDAMTNLAVSLHDAPLDDPTALALLRQAAAEGDALAARNLAAEE